jgi:hypothetical protein
VNRWMAVLTTGYGIRPSPSGRAHPAEPKVHNPMFEPERASSKRAGPISQPFRLFTPEVIRGAWLRSRERRSSTSRHYQ